MEALLARGLFYSVIGFVLAHLEIQIEGKHGWAEKLPTWRWRTALAHRPITGYMLCLNAVLLLLLHLPFAYLPFSPAIEAEILAFFFFLTVFWDFQWFIWNPHYGVRSFRRGNIWWYRSWLGPAPVDYYTGLAASLAIYLTPAVMTGAWRTRAIEWFALLGELAVVTILSVIAARFAVRPLPQGEAS